jgi:hypothetical protein
MHFPRIFGHRVRDRRVGTVWVLIAVSGVWTAGTGAAQVGVAQVAWPR